MSLSSNNSFFRHWRCFLPPAVFWCLIILTGRLWLKMYFARFTCHVCIYIGKRNISCLQSSIMYWNTETVLNAFRFFWAGPRPKIYTKTDLQCSDRLYKHLKVLQLLEILSLLSWPALHLDRKSNTAEGTGVLRPSGWRPAPASEVIDLVRQVDRRQTLGFLSLQVHHAVRLEGSRRLHVTADENV